MDSRDPARITYGLPTLFFTGVFLFPFKLGSRRQIDFLFNSPEFVGNLGARSGQKLIRTPHNDTLAYLCERLSPEQLHGVRLHMVRSLIRSRALDGARLFKKWWMIAVDGTGLVTYAQPHCPRCLIMTRDGRTLWYHNVLEAKLVTPEGLALSIGTEFIENEGPDVSKQDCELKAFFRLATSLKADFPQLPICLVGDSLYACAPVFEAARRYGWRFIFTFKEGKVPTLFSEFEKLKARCPENTARREDDEIVRQFSWVNDLGYAGHRLSVMECVEVRKKIGEATRFVWVTGMEVGHSNYRSIARGGRLRWTIENHGFNTQKNGGYGLEHVFCSDSCGAKNFYLLLQIAHMINHLMEKDSLLRTRLKNLGASATSPASCWKRFEPAWSALITWRLA